MVLDPKSMLAMYRWMDGDPNLHVADVEETGLLARPQVAFHMAHVGIHQRHVKARERDHLGPTLHMQVIELGLAQRLACGGRKPHSPRC